MWGSLGLWHSGAMMKRRLLEWWAIPLCVSVWGCGGSEVTLSADGGAEAGDMDGTDTDGTDTEMSSESGGETTSGNGDGDGDGDGDGEGDGGGMRGMTVCVLGGVVCGGVGRGEWW